MNFFNKVYYKLRLDRFFGVLFSSIDKARTGRLEIMSVDDTVDYIIKTGCSVSRYGDGELHIASEGCGIGFQDADKNLQLALKGLFNHHSKNLLICLPSPLNDYGYMTAEAQNVWKNDLKVNRHAWLKLINKEQVYGDTQFTRPYMDYQDKSLASVRFEKIKEIWRNRKILIVEGEKSRLGVNNDLFDNTDEIRRVLCPSRNAFSKYDDILNFVLKFNKDYLVLIALGPTATVLADDLCRNGFQSIDIGHIDIEYEWCKMGTLDKVQVSGKYTNESGLSQNVEDIYDKRYESEIAGRIC